MSIDKSVYTVLGYDISEHRESLLTDDFRWSDLYEEITNGEIRLFTGSQCRDDNFLYFGYPLFCSEEYGEESPETLEVNAIDAIRHMVDAEWCKYGELFTHINRGRLPFKLICFEEYS
jgi:hypothetical protein